MDPRDKVYGLLGVAEALDIDVDYAKPVEEVLLDAFVAK
jgi:hypothetical protein